TRTGRCGWRKRVRLRRVALGAKECRDRCEERRMMGACHARSVTRRATLLIAATPLLLSLGGAPTDASGGRKPELAAEPDIAVLYAAGKEAKVSEPLPGARYRLIELADYGLKVHVWQFDKSRYRLRVGEPRDAHGSRVGDLLAAKDVLAING